MSNTSIPQPNVSPGFMELLAENRQLREQIGALHGKVSGLMGRYEKVGYVPVSRLDDLLGGDSR